MLYHGHLYPVVGIEEEDDLQDLEMLFEAHPLVNFMVIQAMAVCRTHHSSHASENITSIGDVSMF